MIVTNLKPLGNEVMEGVRMDRQLYSESQAACAAFPLERVDPETLHAFFVRGTGVVTVRSSRAQA